MGETIHAYRAACIPGTEQALCEELRELGFQSVRLNRGGIPFRGSRPEGWRACLQSRIAQRILLLLGRFPASDAEALYQGVQAIDWGAYLTPDQTLSVAVVTRGSGLQHSGFAGLKVKDAIVDQVRSRQGRRPSVDREDPDVRVFVYLVDNKASVYADLSGGSLHRRGYRTAAGEAPLRETLAAALLRMSGWDRTCRLIDPMCGSGTLAIEAALWATNRAPGLGRERFGFERWAGFSAEDAETVRGMRGALRRAVTGSSPRIVAADVDPGMVSIARANARAAGVRISFAVRSFFDLQGSDRPALLITNPPYGKRLALSPAFCRRFGATVCRLHGWRVAVLAGSRDYLAGIPARPVQSLPIRNGDLACRFLVYDVA